jgi:hypothetical protein
VLPRPEIDIPLGAVGIVAPALTDSMHADFYLHTLWFASLLNDAWGKAQAPLTSRFQFPLLDDPTMVRFYPPIEPVDSVRTSEEFDLSMREILPPQEPDDSFDQLRDRVSWLFGGPMEIRMAVRARTDPSVLYNLSSAAAARAMWGDEVFWSQYRARLGASSNGHVNQWRGYFLRASNQVSLAFRPERTSGKTSRR